MLAPIGWPGSRPGRSATIDRSRTASIRSELRLAPLRAGKLAAVAARPSLWRPLRLGVLASMEHRSVSFGARFGTVLDVGASRGQFALFALERFPGARVISFEPIPAAAAAAREVTAGRAEVHQVALGAEPGTARLHLAGSDDSSSLLPIGRQAREFPGTEPAGEIVVERRRLDEYLAPSLPGPVLLKVDVQGYEAEVLEGGGEALALVGEALIECSFVELYEGQALAGEVVARMAAAGFDLVGVGRPTLSAEGEPLQADFHFRGRERR